MKYDVCIVGCGPAGLSSAVALSTAGAKVILIDKQQQPGAKACGGGLTGPAFAELAQLGQYAKIHGQLESHCRLTVHGPNRRFLPKIPCFQRGTRLATTEPYMHVSDRRQWQLGLLQGLPVDVVVQLGARCVRIQDGQVLTDSGQCILADWIVAADGPKSRIRQQLGLPGATGAICRQLVIERAYLESLAHPGDTPAVWFDYRLFGASYGWLFPYGDTVRIGCGVPAQKGASNWLRRSFAAWLQQLSIPVRFGRLETGSIGCRYVGHRFGRILLAGDAAGMASAVTGEGIYQALVSGREVAREILSPGYRSAVIPELAKRHERTFSALQHPVVGRFLLHKAPALLRFPSLSRIALKKFS